MGTVTVHPPASGLYNTITVNGRTYTASPGNPITVPDFDAQIMCSNGWTLATANLAITQGPTSGRPANPQRTTRYLDTTLGMEILFDGLVWRNVITGAQV